MSWRRSLAICRHELRILRANVAQLILFLLMPLVIMLFLKPVFRLSLVTEGYVGATGAEQAVPGMAVMSSLFVAGSVVFAFFREHGWATWDRLRISAMPMEIIAGKVLPYLGVLVLQFTMLYLLGWLLLGLRPRGPLIALGSVVLALSLAVLAGGVVIAAICRSMQQANFIANLGAFVLAGLGGTLAPVSILPAWARRASPISPAYWAMRGSRTVILDGGGLPAVLPEVTVLLGFAAAAVLFAAVRFRIDEPKLYWP